MEMRANGYACTLTDVHAHLFDRAGAALDELITESESAGVGLIINTAVSVDTSITALEQCRRFPQNLKAAVGISPFDTANAGDNWEEGLRKLLTEPSSRPIIAAIGEIGLDCTNPRYPPLDVQTRFFTRQLEIAADAGLPAVIHSRGMEKRTAEICRQHGVRRAVFHCFTGDREALEYIIECGYYISVSGIITFKNSPLRDIIRYMPADRLLIETDAPYLAPVPHRGKPNRPSYLVHTAKEIARILDIGEPELGERLNNNTAMAFGR